VYADVWLRATKMEISAAQWAIWLGKGFSFFLLLKAWRSMRVRCVSALEVVLLTYLLKSVAVNSSPTQLARTR